MGLVLALGLVAAALADSFTYEDARRDNTCCGGGRDFTKATVGHDLLLLRHTARVRGEARPNKVPRLYIDIPGAGKGCEYFVGRLGPPPGEPRVVNCDTSEGAPAEQADKVSDHKYATVFDPEAIGLPDSYRWQYRYRKDGATIDKAPDAKPLHGLLDF